MRTHNNKILFFILFFILAASGFSMDQLVERAMDKMENTPENAFAYTITKKTKEENTIERFNPSKPEGERWTLIKKNGDPPTEKDIEEYEKKKLEEKKAAEKREENNNNSNSQMSLRNMIDEKTVTLVKTSENYRTYSFQASADNNGISENMAKGLEGTFQVNKEKKYISSITLNNTEKLSPVFGVSIDSFFMQMEFSPLSRNGLIVLRKSIFRMQGKAFLVKNIDTDTTSTYSNYQFIGN